ncbi:tripartite tricarboxylate transporter substrate binding protein [Ramlibacter ginsenosidimutans]|uniref:Tripartite tricarboxylate transporter substrate binding protein n=1 Tax=Ramlibacter ginsenosidimutans TaxID=502333 RepID=A0A934TP01_9BURK|nr:tripartite tricarboxylate transporter substrate binding protein [Ramlibacter ginsenosidimutans]MBK6004812.1 tripartite tricarboxylate transporter substrate binding protein [Ramlibacter ginsenosidimutans]
MNLTRRQLLGVAAAGLAPVGLPAAAQSWPSRSIRLVSPYSAGGSNDILTRVLGNFLGAKLGQPVVVENKAGAGTRIANDYVAKAAPDGYTLLHAAAPIAIGEALYTNLPYDVHKSFEPIVSTAIAPLFLVVNADAPYKTVAEFVKWGKANPKGFTFGSPGAGSAPHLTAELFIRAAGAKGLVVQFKGDAPAYTELLAGRIDATLTAVSTAVPYVQAGKLRILAVANEKRTPLQPETPTFVESGLPNVVGYGWYGLMAPAGTPAPILQRLNAETNVALNDPEVRKKAEAVGLQLRGGTAAEFRAFLDSETRKWSQIIKAANIKPE